MKQIDTKCPSCGHITIDVLLRERDGDDYIMPRCLELVPSRCRCLGTCDCVLQSRTCGTVVERVHMGTSGYVIGDDIPGGLLVRNGICNDDGSPHRYYSKSSMREAAAAKGLVNHVEHIATKGSDRNRGRHTQRFI